MEQKQEITVSYLASKIDKEYIFNDYKLTDSQLKDMTETLLLKIQNMSVSKKTVDSFFSKLHEGELGMYYKQPVSFLSIAHTYFQKMTQQLAR